MTLSFPNSARSCDEAHAHSDFGPTYVRSQILRTCWSARRRSQRTLGESEYLASFDAPRSGILTAAKSAYTSRPDNAITLTLDTITE
jgi:hypothetical protein